MKGCHYPEHKHTLVWWCLNKHIERAGRWGGVIVLLGENTSAVEAHRRMKTRVVRRGHIYVCVYECVALWRMNKGGRE